MTPEAFIKEYPLGKVSPAILWNYISSPHGLNEWFADDVIIQGRNYTFIWSKTPQQAQMVHHRTGMFIRFKWQENIEERSYFEFRIHKQELTNDTILQITDFALNDEEKQDNIELWDSQIEKLRRRLGV